ncbi:MAG: family 43 glycosylhydrolase, partial [Lapillicoccus sp.]
MTDTDGSDTSTLAARRVLTARRSSRWLGPLLAACLVALPACQSTPTQSKSPASAPTPSAQKSGTGFQNPVYDLDFPDPMIVKAANGGFLAIATNGNGLNVQTLTSKDLISWDQGPDALPLLPKWSSSGKVWAPEISIRADGRYVLYYTTRGPNPDIQCISVALGSKAQGPYVDRSSKPLVCERGQGGSIDPDPFTASDG